MPNAAVYCATASSSIATSSVSIHAQYYTGALNYTENRVGEVSGGLQYPSQAATAVGEIPRPISNRLQLLS
ncbi:hypothetical protein B0H12DRAFT_1156486 [Mycena haematopus]|nr:hypothetical protein B0H12DRAFT_1156486 [Mycena haematopus]